MKGVEADLSVKQDYCQTDVQGVDTHPSISASSRLGISDTLCKLHQTRVQGTKIELRAIHQRISYRNLSDFLIYVAITLNIILSFSSC